MTYTPVTDRALWNDSLLSLHAPHVLQSWAWCEVKQRHGWTPRRLLWTSDDCPSAG